MPPTEQSITEQQVYINKTNIENLEKAIGRIDINVEQLANHYSNRPTVSMVKFICAIIGLLGVSVGVNTVLLTLIVKLIQ